MRTRSGFTLVELMVVIAIISVLATFTAPKLTRYLTKAKLLDGELYASQAIGNINEYVLLNNDFPSSASDAFIASSATVPIVSSVALSKGQTAGTGTLTVTLAATTGLEAGKNLVYSRQSDGSWQCTSSLPAELLPENCTLATP